MIHSVFFILREENVSNQYFVSIIVISRTHLEEDQAQDSGHEEM